MSFYPLERYLGKTFLGSRTAAYHPSMGCPFYLLILCGSSVVQCPVEGKVSTTHSSGHQIPD